MASNTNVNGSDIIKIIMLIRVIATSDTKIMLRDPT